MSQILFFKALQLCYIILSTDIQLVLTISEQYLASNVMVITKQHLSGKTKAVSLKIYTTGPETFLFMLKIPQDFSEVRLF